MVLAIGLMVGLAGCGDATLTFAAGVSLDLSSSDLIPPNVALDALMSSGGGPDAIASVPCVTSSCDFLMAPPEFPLSCVATLCDPDPVTFSDKVADVDFHDLAMDVASHVDEVELIALDYRILANSLTMGVGDMEVFWCPAGAVGVDPAMGDQPLGTIPAIAAGETGTGEMVLDAVGNQALTDYLRDMSMQVRFFVRTSVDIDPGDAWPAGDLETILTMTVKVTGGII